ncbi:MAG: hypothetical protein ABFQ62_05515 [Patescibacteria group bacterium]
MFKKRLYRELSHFMTLSDNARKMLYSTTIYNATYPLLGLFTNTFILRQSNGFAQIAFYYVGQFISLPIFFYLNGLLLKYIPIKKLYVFGLTSLGLSTTLLFYLPGLSPLLLFNLGFVFSIPNSFYWANRHFITISSTLDNNRDYYVAMEAVIFTITGLIFPSLYGLILHYGLEGNLYSVGFAYKFLIILATFFFSTGGLIFSKSKIPNPKMEKVFIGRCSKKWWRQRIIETIHGFKNGVEFFLPTIIITSIIGGREGTVGAMQSVVAMFSAGFIYVLGRKIKVKQRPKLLLASIFSLIIMSGAFAISPTLLPSIIYVLGLSVTSTLIWQSLNPIIYKVIDTEEDSNPTNNYAYIVDRELFLNVGRIIGTVIFLLLIKYLKEDSALGIIVLLSSLPMLITYKIAKKLNQV